MSIKLVLADNRPLIFKGLEELFSTEPDFTVLAYCLDGKQALQAVRRYSPDILLIDPNMPRKDGWAVLRELQQEGRLTRVVILTETLNEQETLEAIRLGVHGVVLKDMPLHLFIQCLRKVHAGEKWLEKSSVGRVLDWMLQREEGLRQVAAVLTPREIELARLVALGLDNKRIADQIYICEGTVKIHLHHIYAKLEVKNRVELTLYAQKMGLI